MALEFAPAPVPETVRAVKPNPYVKVADKLVADIGKEDGALTFTPESPEQGTSVVNLIRKAVGKRGTVRQRDGENGTVLVWCTPKMKAGGGRKPQAADVPAPVTA